MSAILLFVVSCDEDRTQDAQDVAPLVTPDEEKPAQSDVNGQVAEVAEVEEQYDDETEAVPPPDDIPLPDGKYVAVSVGSGTRCGIL